MNEPDIHRSGSSQAPGIVLWWLPVGAGAPSRVPQVTSQWWERLQARREKRQPQRLVHAALEVFDGTDRYVIEMGPEWSDPEHPHQGVVARGPVGLRPLGRSGLFRYEVRCWAEGNLSDRTWAIDGPVTVSGDAGAVQAVLGRVKDVPTLTWGRSVPATGDMWNSNSLVSWLLEGAGIDATGLEPPPWNRAPGWEAGIAVARKNPTTS